MAWSGPCGRWGAPTVPFQGRGAAVDGEFGLAVEDHEHLFAVIVEMLADAAARRDLAPIEEVEIGNQRVARQQAHAAHVARAAVRAALAVLTGIGMSDALRQRIPPRPPALSGARALQEEGRIWLCHRVLQINGARTLFIFRRSPARWPLRGSRPWALKRSHSPPKITVRMPPSAATICSAPERPSCPSGRPSPAAPGPPRACRRRP